MECKRCRKELTEQEIKNSEFLVIGSMRSTEYLCEKCLEEIVKEEFRELRAGFCVLPGPYVGEVKADGNEEIWQGLPLPGNKLLHGSLVCIIPANPEIPAPVLAATEQMLRYAPDMLEFLEQLVASSEPQALIPRAKELLGEIKTPPT